MNIIFPLFCFVLVMNKRFRRRRYPMRLPVRRKSFCMRQVFFFFTKDIDGGNLVHL